MCEELSPCKVEAFIGACVTQFLKGITQFTFPAIDTAGTGQMQFLKRKNEPYCAK